MGFLFNKKEAPEELPSISLPKLEKIDKVSKIAQEDKIIQNSVEVSTNIPYSARINESILEREEIIEKKFAALPSFENESGYFAEIVKNVLGETENIDKLDSWCKSKVSEDIVSQMRDYWEKQNPVALLKNMNGEAKTKLLEKVNQLHQLEKEWQEAYFNLLSKEERIRDEEQELKESLSEFISTYKKALNRGRRK